MAGSLQISLPNPVYPSPRLVLEAPRPRYVSRAALGHPLRSSPLAGPAIAISRPAISDDTNNADSEKTRRGATPSRISTLHPSPPSSLRSLSSMSRTPSPSRSTSDFSHKSSASSATSYSISPPSSPPPPQRTKVQPDPSHHARVRTSVSVSASDPTRNWLTRTAPPPFSRSHVKGVVMPVKASSGRRPQTAPAALRAHSHMESGSSLGRQVHRRHSQHGNMNYNSAEDSGHSSSGQVHRRHSQHGTLLNESGHARMLDPVMVRKQRRSRSLRTLSVRSTLGEVREEQEREGEDDSEGDGDGDKTRATWAEAQYVKDTLVFPVLTMKAENVEVSNTPGENVTGWIRRRWTSSLKLVKEQFVKGGKVSNPNGP